MRFGVLCPPALRGAALRSGGSGLRAARFVGLVRCRQSPDTSTPVAPRPDYRPRTERRIAGANRAGRAPRRSNGNGRRTAVLSSCRSRRRRPVVRRAHSIPSRKVHIFACANLLHCWRAFVVDRPCPRHIAFVCARSKALLAIRKFHRRRSATERRAKAPRLDPWRKRHAPCRPTSSFAGEPKGRSGQASRVDGARADAGRCGKPHRYMANCSRKLKSPRGGCRRAQYVESHFAK